MAKKIKKLKVTITAAAEFGINQLEDISQWREHIIEYGEILAEDVEVIEEKQ